MERAPTGIPGYDDMLGGGYLPRTANLVEGAPGTGKTTLGLQFIYHGVTRWDEPGLVLTFEESPRQLHRDAAAFGWNLGELEEAGKLRVVLASPEVTLLDLQQTGGRLESMAREMGARRVLIDSLSHFERLTSDPAQLRCLLFGFLNGLKREGLTAVLTRESESILGDEAESGDALSADLAYLVDSYTMMRYVEIDSAVRKALLVLKLRGSAHATGIRQYDIGPAGLDVQARFEGQRGILSGTPEHMAVAFAEAFVRR